MSIRLTEANRAIQAALAKAHNLAVNISVTVCDADGRLVAFQRMDGALAEAHLASIGKALVSADRDAQAAMHQSKVRSISEPQQSLVKELRSLDGPAVCPSFARGQVEGALGVAGATDQQDVECAVAGIDALTSSGTP
jgi:glc operon protein GlcG